MVKSVTLQRQARLDLAFSFVVGYEGGPLCSTCYLYVGRECAVLEEATPPDDCPALPVELQPSGPEGCLRRQVCLR